MGVFRMPSLGADMEAGRLVEGLVGPGDVVARGDVVAVVETQKGAIEIESFEAGRIDSLIAAPGDSLPVGAPLAMIGGTGEAPRSAVGMPPPGSMPAPPAVSPAATLPAARSTPGEVLASPAARVRAREAGIDLAGVKGTGPDGAVRLTDLEAALPQAAPAPRGAKPGLDPQAMRAAIAAAMAKSKREIPHYYLWQDIDLQPAADWLAATNAAREPDRRLLMGALFLWAVARAAVTVPEMNGHYGDGGFRPAPAVHAGLAVSLRGGGLIAPAIHDAQDMSLDALMAAMRDLVARVRGGRLRSSEMADATLTVSSMGDNGADGVLGVIYPPQVALVGFGTPHRRPVEVNGGIALRSVVTVSLAADHRVSDGRTGARFLAEIARHLQEPDHP